MTGSESSSTSANANTDRYLTFRNVFSTFQMFSAGESPLSNIRFCSTHRHEISPIDLLTSTDQHRNSVLGTSLITSQLGSNNPNVAAIVEK